MNYRANRLFPIIVAVIALFGAACSGNFSSGTGMPNTIPAPEASNPGPYGPGGVPEGRISALPSASASPTPTPAQYSVSDAPTGFACPPTSDGYACLLRFNVPPPTPTPAPGSKRRPSPTPSPTPTPTPTPVSSSSPGSPTPSPSPTPAVTLQAQALPTDAPPMYRTTPNPPRVVPVMLVRLTTSNGDFPLTDSAIATFTLPKEQIAKRGFALQVFQVQTSKKHTNYKPLWTFNKSTLKDQTLTFAFAPPKMTIPKASTYAVVLYGDAVAIPSASPSAPPSAQPTSTADVNSGVQGVPGDMPVDQPTPVPSPAPTGT